MPARPRHVLLLGDYRWAPTFARSLHAAGHEVSLVRNGSIVLTPYSRAVGEVTEGPVPEPGGPFADWLLGHLAERSGIDAVLPLGDAELAALADRELEFPEGVELLMADAAVVRHCLDKAAMCRTAGELGIPQAPYAIVRNLEELREAALDVGFPSLVKPTDQLARIDGEKAVILRAEEDIARVFSRWPAGNAELLLQRYVTGPRHNLHLVAKEGKVLVAAETKTLRTTRVDYTGYTVEGVSVEPNAELRAHTEALVAHLGFRGLGCMQFLVDPETGEVSFLELAPRVGASFAVTQVCGVDLPRLAVEALDGPLPPLPDLPVGRRIVWTYGDLQGLLLSLRDGEIGLGSALRWLGRALFAAMRADIHVTWSLADPRPTLALYGGWFLRRLRRRSPARARMWGG